MLKIEYFVGCTVAPPTQPMNRPPMRRYKSDLAWRSVITSGDVKELNQIMFRICIM